MIHGPWMGQVGLSSTGPGGGCFKCKLPWWSADSTRLSQPSSDRKGRRTARSQGILIVSTVSRHPDRQPVGEQPVEAFGTPPASMFAAFLFNTMLHSSTVSMRCDAFTL